MPDPRGQRPASPARAPHVSTSEWQSFEIRMRQRRADRCIARAEDALFEGREDQAAAALEEARLLAPLDTPEIDVLRERVAARRAPLAPPAIRDDVADLDSYRTPGTSSERLHAAAGVLAIGASEDASVEDSPRRRRGAAAAIAAILVLGLGVGAMWFAGQTGGGVIQPAASTAEAVTPEATLSPPRVEPPAPGSSLAPLPEAAQPAPVPSTVQQASTESSPPLPDAGPVRVAFNPPSPTVSTAGGADLPPLAASTADVPVVPPPAPPIAPPTLSATPLDTVAAGVPVTTPSEPRPPVAPPPPPKAAEPAAEPSAEPRIRAVLSSYEAAFRSLDASAVQRVWPGVDARALARAFDGLASQSVSLGQCAFAISGSSATAQCTGSATWTPKVGGGSRTVPRRWQFSLQNAGDDWQIVRAEVR